jgi:hypothetical protein
MAKTHSSSLIPRSILDSSVIFAIILNPSRRKCTKTTLEFKQAVRLQDHLRTFRYDEDVAAKFSYDDIETFLTKVRRGYCEQFAVSFTVLARTLGIPTRIALGFAPGGAFGKNQYSVTTRDAHAWPEVWFPQAGWVQFEPTPRGGFTRPSYTATEDNTTANPTNPDPTDDPTTRPSAAPSNRLPADDPSNPGLVQDSGGIPRWIVLVGVVALIVLVPLGLAGVFALRRRARLKHATVTRERVALTYGDFLAWCAAAGFGRASGETPTEHARRTGKRAPEAAEPLGQLAVLVDEALFAPPNGLDPTEATRAAEQAREALTGRLSRSRRLLAALGWGRR